MRRYSSIFIALFFMFFSLASYAIQVDVQSTSKDVAALGFTVDGKNHGSMGKKYHATGMPVGVYSFGIRANSIFGKDVACSLNGQGSVTLQRDTTAVLDYDGNQCIMHLYN
ncbi:MAG: hypothetical protein SFW66_10160 [Gammaproteobacteria bacterium]|nr:hypothetical protein [Gammaproteobacteria bacterium]